MTVIRSGGVREGWGAQKSRMITWHDPAPTAAIGAAMDGLEYVRATIDGQLPSPPIVQERQCTLTALLEKSWRWSASRFACSLS